MKKIIQIAIAMFVTMVTMFGCADTVPGEQVEIEPENEEFDFAPVPDSNAKIEKQNENPIVIEHYDRPDVETLDVPSAPECNIETDAGERWLQNGTHVKLLAHPQDGFLVSSYEYGQPLKLSQIDRQGNEKLFTGPHTYAQDPREFLVSRVGGGWLLGTGMKTGETDEGYDKETYKVFQLDPSKESLQNTELKVHEGVTFMVTAPGERLEHVVYKTTYTDQDGVKRQEFTHAAILDGRLDLHWRLPSIEDGFSMHHMVYADGRLYLAGLIRETENSRVVDQKARVYTIGLDGLESHHDYGIGKEGYPMDLKVGPEDKPYLLWATNGFEQKFVSKLDIDGSPKTRHRVSNLTGDFVPIENGFATVTHGGLEGAIQIGVFDGFFSKVREIYIVNTALEPFSPPQLERSGDQVGLVWTSRQNKVMFSRMICE